MGFISIPFVLVTIASIFIFYLLNDKYRIGYLTVLSCGFIASYNYYLLSYIIVYSLINFYIGIKLPYSKFKIALFRTGVLINLSQLIVLKYASFAIDPIFNVFQSNLQISNVSEIIVPIGVSYFTLQGIGYLVNVKMGWEKPEKKLLHFLLFITFYPKFLSGPIERSNHFLPQLKENKSFNELQVIDGLRTALFGVFKKVVVANQLAPYVLDRFTNLNAVEGYSLWITFLITPLYLYFDFSGYTDIAIGLAKTMGIELRPNFNRPFFSENVTTFWKRFHMSLSSWFGDYVFRQISFKRRKWGVYASTYAVFVTWILFGIWHGAGWTFMLLGLLQAIVINYEFFTKKIRVKLFSKLPVYLGKWIGRMFTYLFYCVSLVFFFSPNLSSVLLCFKKLVQTSGTITLEPMSRAPYTLLIFIPVLLLIELIKNDFHNTNITLESMWWHNNIRTRVFRWTVFSLIILFVLLFSVDQETEQFIYINF